MRIGRIGWLVTLSTPLFTLTSRPAVAHDIGPTVTVTPENAPIVEALRKCAAAAKEDKARQACVDDYNARVRALDAKRDANKKNADKTLADCRTKIGKDKTALACASEYQRATKAIEASALPALPAIQAMNVPASAKIVQGATFKAIPISRLFSTPVANADFEEDSLAGWTIAINGAPPTASRRTCGVIATVPSSSLTIGGRPAATVGGNYWDVPFRATQGIGQHASCWLRTGGDAVWGLQTPLFTVGYRYLTFLARRRDGNARVQIVPETGDPVGVDLRVGTSLESYTIDMGAFMNRRARVRITGQVDIDNFKLQDTPQAQTVTLARPDTGNRVWGTADVHMHLVNHLGFGGIFHGKPWGQGANPLQDALPWCNGPHGPGGTRVTPDPYHLVGGYPQFDGWPNTRLKMHQQVYVDWLRRAWQGGLRLASTLVGHSEFMAHNFLTAGGRNLRGWEYDQDSATIERELDAIWEFANGPGRGWAEIALSGPEARRIASEGKLALVLGIEVEAIGDFGTHVQLPQDEAARSRIRDYLRHLHDRGVRQITPIHMTTNAFGGAGVYGKLLDMQNRWLTGRWYDQADGFNEGIRYRYDQDNGGASMWFLALINGLPEAPFFGHRASKQQLGLKPAGRILLQEMMRLGMIIDTDHMGDVTFDETMRMAEDARLRYPAMIASHASFRETVFGWNATQPFSDATKAAYGTSDMHKVASEMNKTAAQVERIRAIGGILGLGVSSAGDVRQWGAIPANCDGTTKSWVQRYLYAIEKMGGRGVMLGTDFNGLVGLPGPRFGVRACEAAHHDDDVRRAVWRGQATTQANGVRYRTPIIDAHRYRFEGDGDGDHRVTDFTEALAWAKAGVNPDTYDGRDGGIPQLGWIRAAAKGFAAGIRRAPLAPALMNDEGARLAWDISMGNPPTWNNENAQIIRRVWTQWANMEGTNPPLERQLTAQRDWDINLDGLAHVGMLPDFLQDARNVGLTPEQMAPLFHGAEDYIAMWEQAEVKASTARVIFP